MNKLSTYLFISVLSVIATIIAFIKFIPSQDLYPKCSGRIPLIIWMLSLYFGFFASIKIIKLTKEISIKASNYGLVYGIVNILFHLLSALVLLSCFGGGRA